MSLNEIVCRNLRVVRRRRKFTQEKLAKKAKVSISYVSMIERAERSPPLETVEKLAKALAVDPLSLFRG
ncbi:MAG TPA: helix-turn-helix transcriptional regulator [Anaeromyxobacteraceae bacterium]|nr:helix-turn-helix transcriptional regulator [Anaeromyxobacteraceae bacterium]